MASNDPFLLRYLQQAQAQQARPQQWSPPLQVEAPQGVPVTTRPLPTGPDVPPDDELLSRRDTMLERRMRTPEELALLARRDKMQTRRLEGKAGKEKAAAPPELAATKARLEAEIRERQAALAEITAREAAVQKSTKR